MTVQKGEEKRSNRTRQDNKTADGKIKSNDSPEISNEERPGGGHQKCPAALETGIIKCAGR